MKSILEETVLDTSTVEAIQAIQVLVDKYCNGRPLIQQVLMTWQDNASPQDVLELAFKEKRSSKDLAKVGFNRVALDVMIVSVLENFAQTLDEIKEELIRINFVLDTLCKDSNITKN